MDPVVFRILEKKRHGHALSPAEIRQVSDGAADGSWGEAELGAFLMACSIRGLDLAETRALTECMLESGEQWDLARDLPGVGDKHSTGGVGDKVSLLLAPLMAAVGRPVMMLAGRGLGHTGGTTDKLEAIPGVDLSLDRKRCLDTLRRTGMAIGQATGGIAPADKTLYALRDRTATIDVIPLICGSILSKKLAVGAAAIVFDVKCGDGAFMRAEADAIELARQLVGITRAMGREARALVTDMNQPLGRWVGHSAEVGEIYECFRGEGFPDFLEVTFRQCEELAEMTGGAIPRARFEEVLLNGEARAAFEAWAASQGADPAWLADPTFELAPEQVPLVATRAGVLARVHNRLCGEYLAEAGGGRLKPDSHIDFGVSLEIKAKLGDRVEAGQELARLYLRRRDADLEQRFQNCFEVADHGQAPPLILERIA
jgi:pyrimidine-nucleoside phosphorylase